MKLELLFFIGVFCNILLAMIFPYQLLPQSTAESLIESSEIGYTIDDNIFGSDAKTSTSDLYDELRDEKAIEGLTNAETTEVSILDSISNFFDGLFDGLAKIKTYFLLLLPFGAVLGLLPGAIGLMFQLLYMALAVFSIIMFIRRG